MTKQFVLVPSLVFAATAMAEGPTCNASAAEKKLAGAAKTSFLTLEQSPSRTGIAARDVRLAAA